MIMFNETDKLYEQNIEHQKELKKYQKEVKKLKALIKVQII